ncbi:conserved hypothetical protein [Methylobacillus flagellatus KT]|uniref:Exopolysaccharide biosynthesis operon protein EpsL n=1 Tax=Methylobacillus flagellatus (strain ATCC 51484 / DSM 6875 / VKM B-1610 / KT) TaxID=265072 RepID=Q1GZP1_METFK|nr:conserved hypothetical protein [Methylobacillus flagellatus KT]
MRLSQSTNLIKIALVAGLGIELAGFVVPACALEGDVLKPYASLTYSYDDNLRRFASKQLAQMSTGSSDTSDTMLVKSAGIVLDHTISRQKMYVDFRLNKSTFNKNSELDNDGRDVIARWDWELGNRLEGKVEFFHKKALVPFSEFQPLQGTMLSLNTRTQDRRLLEARWMLHPRWRVRGAFIYSEMEYGAEAQRAANLKEDIQEIGFDYLSPTKSIIGVLYRNTKGSKPQQAFQGSFISNDYDQNELKLNVDWAVTGKSRLQFLGGLVDRQHEQLSQRDFRGVNARGNFNWMTSGKTNLNAAVWRENNAQSFVTTSYTLNRGTSLTANLQATGKIAVQGVLKYEKRDFEGDQIFGQFRSDKDKSFMLSLMYNPVTSFRITTSFIHSDRESTSDMFEFRSNSVSVTGQYEF